MTTISVIPPFDIPRKENDAPFTFLDYIDLTDISPTDAQRIVKVIIFKLIQKDIFRLSKPISSGVWTLIRGERLDDDEHLTALEKVIVRECRLSVRNARSIANLGKYATKEVSGLSEIVMSVANKIENNLNQHLREYYKNEIITARRALTRKEKIEDTIYGSGVVVAVGSLATTACLALTGNMLPLIIAGSGVAVIFGGTNLGAEMKRRLKNREKTSNEELEIVYTDFEAFKTYLKDVASTDTEYFLEGTDSEANILEHLIMLDAGEKWPTVFAPKDDKGYVKLGSLTYPPETLQRILQ